MKNIQKSTFILLLGLGMSALAVASPALDKEIDTLFKEGSQTLPEDMGDGLTVTSMKRVGNVVMIGMKFDVEGISAKDFKEATGREDGKDPICTDPAMKDYLDHGYTIQFDYTFKDKTKVSVPVKKSDC